MYIEMTTFTIPTFIISMLKLIMIGGLVWFTVGFIGVTIYWFSTGRK
jgi:hypothetical protein